MRPSIIIGTRPEAVKLAPVVWACRAHHDVDPILASTGQHRELLQPITRYFQIEPDFQFDLMTPGQSLARLTARCLEALDELVAHQKPDCIVAQGDTTTAMAASLVAFYRRTPLVHVEAGLRTGNLEAPWPEEMNRKTTSLLASLHCAPTQQAADNLLAEGVPPSAVCVTGNPVVDALLETQRRERARAEHWRQKYAQLADAPMVLVTAHRRESFGAPLENIARAIRLLADRFDDHAFVYPVHNNPNVREPILRLLGDAKNVCLVDPVPYPEFVWLMDRSKLILTDSGGVQEEAPSLGKPLVVMRETTERPEVVAAGGARLVGTSSEKILEAATRLLTDPAEYAACQLAKNPYGDGHAAERIVREMVDRLCPPS